MATASGMAQNQEPTGLLKVHSTSKYSELQNWQVAIFQHPATMWTFQVSFPSPFWHFMAACYD